MRSSLADQGNKERDRYIQSISKKYGGGVNRISGGAVIRYWTKNGPILHSKKKQSHLNETVQRSGIIRLKNHNNIEQYQVFYPGLSHRLLSNHRIRHLQKLNVKF